MSMPSWPSVSNRRPVVTLPTGTEIGAPVSVAGIPRLMPSVEDMATQRAVELPSCCATSSTRSMPRSPSTTVIAL